MSQHLSKKDVENIAAYTHIGLSDEELDEMTGYLNKVLDTLAPVKNYELEGVEPSFYPIGKLKNVMREDTPQPSFTQEQALQNAAQKQDSFFLIPSILSGGDE